MSLPSRERGLKQIKTVAQASQIESLPSRERGLKHWGLFRGCFLCVSLPSRERGLKRVVLSFRQAVFVVAPLAGAWIETHTVTDIFTRLMSLPSRERGLKLFISYTPSLQALSLPSRERGLKPLLPFASFGIKYVAPLAGAWIETNPLI